MRGKLEILNFSEDIDDLEINVHVLLDPPCSEALRNVIKKGAIIADIKDTLVEYVTSIQAQYGGNPLVPSNTTVRSKTVINNCKPAGSLLASQIPTIKKSKKPIDPKRLTVEPVLITSGSKINSIFS